LLLELKEVVDVRNAALLIERGDRFGALHFAAGSADFAVAHASVNCPKDVLDHGAAEIALCDDAVGIVETISSQSGAPSPRFRFVSRPLYRAGLPRLGR
jgi:hypothetical protein